MEVSFKLEEESYGGKERNNSTNSNMSSSKEAEGEETNREQSQGLETPALTQTKTRLAIWFTSKA